MCAQRRSPLLDLLNYYFNPALLCTLQFTSLRLENVLLHVRL